ncbi:bifunctional riboflavin kinase/FAD synthetase [Legionella fallonii]|uniref:Riboflavin biosynthesis protein n=1 Tax=Legionella fallonii LLAP-10 TaxID=1212491 RepID=A0A098G1U8_9GAMM|nr:bifunctional riboflavin kinase/FAD synthetase [Legionella fallonii]CEG56452.1 bifunctional riboflavin kinase and FAD synthetase [Legionella fallonii LLAP-10]
MKLLRGVQHFAEFDKGVVATIGNFDGVHLGHQRLIRSLKDKANQMNLPCVLILFEPQPREYFQKERAPARLSSLREKLDILKQCRIDYVYCIKFDKAFAQTTASDFVQRYLFSVMKVKYLLVGRDFQFGKNREGDVALLQNFGMKHGCEVQTYQDYCIKEERVSSTKIRTSLQQGNIELAAEFLGRLYSICGRVIRGDGRGRQWGIPTANLSLHRISLPLQGVFVVEVHRGANVVQGVANIGKRPTVDGTKNILEIHLFDFDDSIYGELLQVFFLHKLRDEVKFTSVDALITQIHNDIVAAKAFLNPEV